MENRSARMWIAASADLKLCFATERDEAAWPMSEDTACNDDNADCADDAICDADVEALENCLDADSMSSDAACKRLSRENGGTDARPESDEESLEVESAYDWNAPDREIMVPYAREDEFDTIRADTLASESAVWAESNWGISAASALDSAKYAEA